MNFSYQIEYIYHLTCKNCKFYWTYATMEQNFKIEKLNFFCPNCGVKGISIHEKEL